jgi:hypothetical protein|tara:strand:+ start:67 stop:546 length:480 start_codon:yes stop_codon:yes gene_type:complete
MKKETIDLLNEIILGEIYPCCQELDEIGKEKQETLSKLYRMEVLSKTTKGSYKVGKSKLLSKFIELQDFEKLSEYIESESKRENITINGVYIENNENSINQSFENIANKKQVKPIPNKKPEQKSFVKKLFSNWWFRTFLVIFIEEITFGKILEFIKQYV